MPVLFIHLLLTASLLLTISMNLAGGVLVLTTEYGETYLFSPLWLLIIQIPMAFGFLSKRGTGTFISVGTSGGLAFCLALELYVYLQVVESPVDITVGFHLAHIVIFMILAISAVFSLKYVK
ncbi:MAG: hypothetical protein KJ950_02655 [Proteobacteria bacterium]|nr:hypothetical protein [Pseudomonadota bacterium]MBU1686778.1 hypothetical protein [Pseudomonadota bacterium]